MYSKIFQLYIFFLRFFSIIGYYKILNIVLCVLSLNHVWLFVAPQSVAHQAPLSWDFPGKNTGVGCHCLLQGSSPFPGIELTSLASPALAGGFFTTSATWIGEGNGNPLQCSCLEKPRDGEPGGLPSMGWHRVGYDWSNLAAAAAAAPGKPHGFLCYTVNPYCLSILCIAVYIC